MAYYLVLVLPVLVALTWVGGGGLMANGLIDLVFFVLPAVEIYAWLITRLMRPALLEKRWPFLAALGVCLGCVVVIALMYSSIPSPRVAYEGDEADPRGPYILILTVNAISGSAAFFGLLFTSLVGRWFGIKRRNA